MASANANHFTRGSLERIGNIHIALAQLISAQAHESFDGINGLSRFQRPHSGCRLPHQRLALRREMNNRRRQSRAVLVGDEDREARLHHADERVGRAEINANNFVHRHLVLVGIDNILARHGHAERRQRVQDPDRALVRRQDFRQPAIRLWRFVEIATAQHHLFVRNPFFIISSCRTRPSCLIRFPPTLMNFPFAAVRDMTRPAPWTVEKERLPRESVNRSLQ